ncbi:MAG: DUF3883 domain-containing protein [Solirubrobacterales bacterium]|nr:DUF3883 domain-containing protein [Solirubrobacterales bacterium]
MPTLEDLAPGTRITGVIPGKTVAVVAVMAHGQTAIELTYKDDDGKLDQRVLQEEDQQRLQLVEASARPFDAKPEDFKLAAEAQRIKLAGHSDPMLAVTNSNIEPLPHQLTAVYEEMLPRRPLRFLLADDPGAGKTIMAGLYIKELILRDDVKRCLVIAPGGLVDQWQEELYEKFGLEFDLLTPELISSPFGGSIFDRNPHLIARMDQLSRNDEMLDELRESRWDLIVVDEAHRMSANYFGNKLNTTKRYRLGELLDGITRHLLFMTATPHAGKDDSFRLFMSLVDRDRFGGRSKKSITPAQLDGVMRRMVKEKLLTFEGKQLFPKRIAETVNYELSPNEQHLYEMVTDYVREGMNRADKLTGKRKNIVGFALTVLQRRLASSPEAILRSLERRQARLEKTFKEIQEGRERLEAREAIGLDQFDDVDLEDFDDDDYSAEDLEGMEDEALDAATAAATLDELDAEIEELKDLVAAARRVRNDVTDVKWTQLKTILEGDALATSSVESERRKLIIFTEHKDTLEYLRQRIGQLTGRPESVTAIHGGVSRHDRRQVTEEFTQNPDCQILLATDAAGEGLNLQVAHLMVNYDMPWNPNRIEQRFGRIHRIGQKEVCRLWNLVAINTREGQVFDRLLHKLEEQRKALGEGVFDVLGQAFSGTPLRDLLLEAIRFGEQPEVRAQMDLVIDASVGEGLKDLIEERALAAETLKASTVEDLRRQMDEAKARRLQPHFIEAAFKQSFERLGGRMPRREEGRFEISRVPQELRDNAHGPVASKYERVTFEIEHIDDAPGAPAALIAPGHPLHDVVTDTTIDRLQDALDRGATLVSPNVDEPKLLVGVRQSVADATEETVAERFSYVYVGENGEVQEAGPAPYLDCVAAPDAFSSGVIERFPWIADAEDHASSWVTGSSLGKFASEVRAFREAELIKQRDQVRQRLDEEIERLNLKALDAREKAQRGKKVREGHDSIMRQVADLERRLDKRLVRLDQQLEMHARPPRIGSAAVVLPADLVLDQLPASAPMHAKETKEVERRGVDFVLRLERELGRTPAEQPFNNEGFDILSERPGGLPLRIEVKARIAGADDFYITQSEIRMAQNTQPNYRLALVRVSHDGADHDEVRYIEDPARGFDAGALETAGIRVKFEPTWESGREPF